MSRENKTTFTGDGLRIFVLFSNYGKKDSFMKKKIMHRPFASYFTLTHALLWMCLILIGLKEFCVESKQQGFE